MPSMSPATLLILSATLSPLLSSGTALAQAADSAAEEDVDLRQPHGDPAVEANPANPPEEASVQKGPEMHRLDVGLTMGLNNPGGIYGVETDFRLIDRFSVGLAVGRGAWGVRITPQVRLYPFRITNAGLFLESGLSLNLGRRVTTPVNGTVVQEADMAFTPVANVSLGYRVTTYSWGWSAIRVGYGFSLKKDNYTLRDDSVLDPLLETVLKASSPGGFLIGVSGGFSAL